MGDEATRVLMPSSFSYYDLTTDRIFMLPVNVLNLKKINRELTKLDLPLHYNFIDLVAI